MSRAESKGLTSTSRRQVRIMCTSSAVGTLRWHNTAVDVSSHRLDVAMYVTCARQAPWDTAQAQYSVDVLSGVEGPHIDIGIRTFSFVI